MTRQPGKAVERQYFEPLDVQARWRMLFEIIAVSETDELITYEMCIEALGLDINDVKSRTIVQQNMLRATKELEAVHKRTVETVRSKGYRVVKPEAHLRLAGDKNKKAGRTLKRGSQIVQSTDLNKIKDPAVVSKIQEIHLAFASQMEVNRRVAARIQRNEHVTAGLQDKTAASERKIRDLEKAQAKIAAQLAMLVPSADNSTALEASSE